jgi:hypothetical protein
MAAGKQRTRATSIKPPHPDKNAPPASPATPDLTKVNPHIGSDAPVLSGKMVTVSIPQAFNLLQDNHVMKHYEAGIDEMPIEHATHWYSLAHGVEIHKG